MTLESNSEHPLARAVVAFAGMRGAGALDLKDFQSTAGFGLSAMIGGERAYAGKPEWLEQNGISLAAYGKELAEIGAQGVSVLCFAKGNKLLGFLGIADTIKPDAQAAVQALKALHVRPWLLTGDRREAANAIAREAGIADVMAEILPADKAGQVKTLQAGGLAVAMVGDGINDAPALKQADVGLAMASGTDIAMETADVILNSRELKSVPDAIRLSRAVIRNIRQNLFWAFFYNVIGIPIAAGLLYPFFGITLSPMIAAAAMSLSSVTVVTNALRLKRFTTENRKEKSTMTIMPQMNAVPVQIDDEDHRHDGHSRHVEMRIGGMSCKHCKMTVENALLAVPGVLDASVDLDRQAAEITVGDNTPNLSLIDAVESAGYTVKGVS
jgi:P-type Cu+ transporter